MEIFTKEEMQTMTEYNCCIHKLCYSWDMREEEIMLIDRFGEDVSRGLPYMEKSYAEPKCRMKVVTVFKTEEGMNKLMKKWPKDQLFIERDFVK